MEFRDHAAKEAGSLAERLFPASADVTRQRLRAFRSAIEGATKALESALTTPPHLDRDINEFVARLTDLARAEADEAVRRASAGFESSIGGVRAELQAAHEEQAALSARAQQAADRVVTLERHAAEREAELGTLQAALAHAQESLGRAEASRADLVEARERDAASLAHAEHEVHTVRGLLDAAQAELASTTTDLEMAIASRAALEETMQAAEAGSRESAARLAALEGEREELAARARGLEASLADRNGQVERLEAALEDRAARAAALEQDLAERTARIEALQQEIGELRPQLDGLRAELRDRQDRTASLDAELASRARRIEALEADLAGKAGRLDAADAALVDSAARITSLESALAEGTSGVTSLQSALVDSSARLNALEASLAERSARAEALEAALADRSGRVEALEAELAERADRIATLEAALRDHTNQLTALAASGQETAARRTELEAALSETLMRAGNLETLHQEQERMVRELEAQLQAAVARTADHDRRTAGLLGDLVGSFQALAGSPTIADVLHTTVTRLAAAYPRVALFRLKGNRLEGAHQVGFDSNTDIAKIIVPLGLDSLLTRAASSGRPERLSGEGLPDSTGLPFGGAPTCAIALPMVVHGDTLAVVYADDGGEPGTAKLAHQFAEPFAEALLQHALSLLMRLTAELKALAELRDYARSLFSEIEEMFIADTIAGKGEDDLHRRLKGNLEYARSIYATRVAMEGPGAASLLEDELGAILDAKGTTPFGRALATVAGQRAAVEQKAAAC